MSDLNSTPSNEALLSRSFSFECVNRLPTHELFSHRACCARPTAPLQTVYLPRIADRIEATTKLPLFEPEFLREIQRLYSVKTRWWPEPFEYPSRRQSAGEEMWSYVRRGEFRSWLKSNVRIWRTLDAFARGYFTPTASFPSFPCSTVSLSTRFPGMDPTNPATIRRRVTRYRICSNVIRHLYRSALGTSVCDAEEIA